MEEKKTNDPAEQITDFITRRDFCRQAIKRSSIVLTATATGAVEYRKPAVRSFFGPGRFSLKGDSN